MRSQLALAKAEETIAKAIEKQKNAVNEKIKAMREAAKEEEKTLRAAERAQKQYNALQERALVDNIIWHKKKAAQEAIASAKSEAEAKKAADRLLKIEQDAQSAYDKMRDKALVDHITWTKKKAAADERAAERERQAAERDAIKLATLEERVRAKQEREEIKADKDREARILAHQKIIGRHWAKYYDDMEKGYADHQKFLERDQKQIDRNAKSLGFAANVVDAFRGHLDRANNSSNRFYVRLLGLRLSILGVVAVLPAAIGGVTQLVGALIAVANAAALAGAAIGGALIAGMAQATPVIGLLVVAFKKLFDIAKLAGEQQKQAGAASDAAADKSLALARRLEQERESQIALADAQRRLIEARKDALRNIEDLNEAEKESLLNSRRATLGLIGAQAALAGAVSGGGSALDIAGAQLDVTDAQNNIGSSSLAASRASSAASTARRQSVAGNPGVISAQQAITSQQRQMALASAEFARQQRQTNKTLDEYTKKINELNPAQRRLFDAIVAIRKEWKDEWSGITDPIIDAFTGIVKGITSALKDTDIQNAFKGLSGATGGAVTTSTSFFGTPEAKKLFLQVVKDAKANLPLIARILRDITAIFGRVAVAAGPFVHIILRAITRFFDDLEVKTRDSTYLSDFFKRAFDAAYQFWRVFTGILAIFTALGAGGGTKTGVDLVGQFATYLHSIAKEIRENPEGVKKFFDGVKETMGDLGSLLDGVFRIMLKIQATGAFDRLIKLIDKFLLPLMEDVLTVAGKIFVALADFALTHPDLVKTIALFVGIGIAGYEILKVVAGIGKLLIALRLITIAQLVPIIATFAGVLVVLAALGIAIYLLDKKFHFLAPTFKWLKETFFTVIEYVSKHWRGLLILLTGPLGLVIVTIVNNFDKIRKAAVDLKNKMAPIFGFIVDHIVKPLWENALKPILEALGDIVGFFNDNDLVDIFGGAFNKVVEIVTDLIDKLQTAYGVLKDIATLGGIIGGGSGAGNGSVAGSNGNFRAGTANPAGAAGISGALGRNPLRQGGGGAGGGGFVTSTGGIIPDSAVGRLPTSNSGQEDVTPTSASKDNSKAAALANRAQAIADIMDNMPRTDSRGKKISGYPYAWGGGHGALGKPSKAFGKKNRVTNNFETGFDCSGAVSAVLGAIGALNSPLDSSGLANWGVPAQGNEPIVVYANAGHVFMKINGITYTTGAGEDSGFGRGSYGTGGFTARTLPGFAQGGMVPGPTDTVPAMLTPGEMVLTQEHQNKLGGTGYLSKILGFARGAIVPMARPSLSGGGRDQSVPQARAITANFNRLVEAFTKLDQYFVDAARAISLLAQKQRSKIINARYLVGGSGRNTVAIDTGSDLADAQATRGNLGVQRDQINNSLYEANSALNDAQNKLKNVPKGKKFDKIREQYRGAVQRYTDKQAELQDALNQNTLDLVAAQAAIIQSQIDQITSNAQRALSNNQFRIDFANLTGIGKAGIPGLIQEQIGILQAQKDSLYNGPLQQAVAQGNTTLYQAIVDQMTGIDQAIAQAVVSKADSVIQAIMEDNDRRLIGNDMAGRVAGLGGNSFNSLNRQSEVLASRGDILRQNRASLAFHNFAPNSLTPAQTQAVIDAQNELDIAIRENTDAQRDNTEQVAQANVDRIKSAGAFRGGINSGVIGLIESLAQSTGALDLPAKLRSLNNQKGNLQSTGAGLRGELMSQFGINLSSDPNALISQLNSTDFAALTFGMTDNTKATFEDLITSIIENATALSENTNELKDANGQSIQDWSSSLWSTFRDALFTGNGGILGNIPQAATGAHIMAGGLLRVHAGETIVPASISKYQSTDQKIEVNIDNRGDGDVDPLSVSKRIAFELSNRGR